MSMMGTRRRARKLRREEEVWREDIELGKERGIRRWNSRGEREEEEEEKDSIYPGFRMHSGRRAGA